MSTRTDLAAVVSALAAEKVKLADSVTGLAGRITAPPLSAVALMSAKLGPTYAQLHPGDYLGRKVETYRCSDLVFATQGAPTVPVKDGAQFEGSPAFAVPGHPFTISTSNVN